MSESDFTFGGSSNKDNIPQEENSGTYTMILHQETGDNAVSLFGATGEDTQALSWSPTQVTESDLRSIYGESNNLQNVFGSFDRYMDYIEESSDMIEAQDWFSQEGIDQTTAAEEQQEEDDLAFGPGQQTPEDDTQQSDANARQGAYASWMNSAENQALMNKYGIPTEEFTNEKGDRFRWTGTGFARTYKLDRTDFGDYVAAAGASALMLAAPQLAAALVNVGMTAASAGALASGTLSLASQAATTGNVDLDTVIQDALSGAAGGLFGDANEVTSIGAGDIANAIRDAINDVSNGEFGGDYGDIVWQDVDVTDVLGDLQIQIPDYTVTEETEAAAAAAAEEAAAAAEEAAAAAEEEAAAAEEEAAAEALKDYEEAVEQANSAIRDAIDEGDFATAEQIGKDYNEEYGEFEEEYGVFNSDINGEANKDIEAAEESYKDREREAEELEKEVEEEQTNSGIEVDWADYEIVGQREDGCYDVRQKSTGEVFVACPGDVVDGVSVDSGTADEEIDVFTDTTDEGEDDFTFGGSTAKDAEEEEEVEVEVVEEEEEVVEEDPETAKDVAEQLLKDTANDDTEGGLTFGGADTKDAEEEVEVVEEEEGEADGTADDKDGETELDITLDATKDGEADGIANDKDGEADGTADDKDGEADGTVDDKDGEVEEDGLTFGGDSNTKDGESDGTADGDKDGDGEEQAESLFGLTKDGGGFPAAKGGLGFNSFMAGINYEAPTIQQIVQSPKTDYVAELDKIINNSMFKGLI